MVDVLPIPDTMIAPIASFLFVFAVVFGLLITVSVIHSKPANIIIALVIALFSALYSPITSILITIMPIASIILIFLFFVIFIKKVMMPEKEGGGVKDSLPLVVTLVALLFVLAAIWGQIALVLPAGITPDMILWIIGIFIVAMIFFAIYQHNPSEK